MGLYDTDEDLNVDAKNAILAKELPFGHQTIESFELE